MKVLDLRCGNDHRFEGWFDSEDDFQSQDSRGLVQCPVCADDQVLRLPSAPRLNVANLRSEPTATPAPDVQTVMQTQWMRAVRQVMANTEDVGERFPEEARRIHYGEIEQRGIRGQASSEAAEALREEGIEVFSLPVPPALKGPIQ
jgi:hypothetical protein